MYIKREDAIWYTQWEGAYKVAMYIKDLPSEKVKPALSDEEYNSLCERMVNCVNLGTEDGHIEADSILLEVLEKMGYKKLVKLYRELDKWYS